MGPTPLERFFQVVFKIHVVFEQRPRRELEETSSCRIQGESVRHVHLYVRTSVPPPPPLGMAQASQRLALASQRLALPSQRLTQATQRLAQASQRLTQASQILAQVSERLVKAILKLVQAT